HRFFGNGLWSCPPTGADSLGNDRPGVLRPTDRAKASFSHFQCDSKEKRNTKSERGRIEAEIPLACRVVARSFYFATLTCLHWVSAWQPPLSAAATSEVWWSRGDSNP